MTAAKQSFLDLWFLPETNAPEHMYYIGAQGAKSLPKVDEVLTVAAESLHPTWVEASRLAYDLCLVAAGPDVILLHDTSGDPRLAPNAWATCPKHGAVAGPAFLLWRAAWGQKFEIPAAASDIVRKRDDWHIAAWLIERHVAPLRAQLARHGAAYPITGAGVREALAVLAPVHAALCDSTVPVALFDPIREADGLISECRKLLDAEYHDPWRSANAITEAASKVVPVLLEMSRLGAFSTLDLSAIGADRLQANPDPKAA